MMKILQRCSLFFISCLIISANLSALTITSPTTITLNGNIGDLYIDANDVTIIVPSELGINNLTINNRNNVRFQVNGYIQVTGNIDIRGANNSDSVIFRASLGGEFSWINVTNTSASVYIRNASIINTTNPSGGLYKTGGTVILENVLLRGAVPLRTTNITKFIARFCSFIYENISSPHSTYLISLAMSTSATTPPVLEFCYFEKAAGTTYHLNSLSIPGTGSVEGSRFNGGTPQLTGTGTWDTNPLASSGDPLAGTLTFSGNAGNINFDKVIPPGAQLNIGTGGLTMPSGTLKIGYTEYNGGSYAGNASILTAAGQNIAINSGAAVRSEGVSNNLLSGSGQWGSLILESGSSANIKNTTIERATIGIIDNTGAIVQNNYFSNFNANTTANRITAGNGNYSSNTYNITSAGIEITGGNPVIQNNTFATSFKTNAAITVTNGTPTIRTNTINYAATGYGVRVSGGSPTFNQNTIIGSNGGDAIRLTGGYPIFTQNNISGYGSSYAVNATAGGPFTLENNWWGKNLTAPEDRVIFGGTVAIDYEPWLNAAYPSGVATSRKPFTTTELGAIYPPDGTVTTNIITGVSFNVGDLGYHNGAVLQYQIDVAVNTTNFISAYSYTLPSASLLPGQGGTIFLPFSSIGLPPPAQGNTYFWRVRAQNTTDGLPWSDYGAGLAGNYYWFRIDQPQIILTVAADKIMASAGEQVNYTLSYRNPETIDMGNVIITAILPDEVYSNGTVSLAGIDSSNGSVILRAYDAIAGGTQLGIVSTTSGGTISNSTGGWVSAANNYRIKRLELEITVLRSVTSATGKSGTFTYQTVVK